MVDLEERVLGAFRINCGHPLRYKGNSAEVSEPLPKAVRRIEHVFERIFIHSERADLRFDQFARLISKLDLLFRYLVFEEIEGSPAVAVIVDDDAFFVEVEAQAQRVLVNAGVTWPDQPIGRLGREARLAALSPVRSKSGPRIRTDARRSTRG